MDIKHDGSKHDTERLGLISLRAGLAGLKGERYWRSLEELAGSEAFERLVRNEFPGEALKSPGSVGRRQFLRLMGASVALAGLGACARPPKETIVPYVRQPEEIVPGKPLYFATAMTRAGYSTGLLVESHMGRPTKIEGNPDHPESLGASDAFSQASVLALYDPDRSPALTYLGRIRPWSQFLAEVQQLRMKHKETKGKGLRILTETVSSPSLGVELNALAQEFPAAKWHQWEPAGRHHTRAGALLAFGEYVETQYRVDRADVVLAFGADPLTCDAGNLRYVHDFALRRRADAGTRGMNRLYVVEGTPSSTGMIADHRLPLSVRETQDFAFALADILGVQGPAPQGDIPENERHWLAALARDLQEHRGSSLMIVGEHQPPSVHALAHAVNRQLGNIGQTVVYTEPVEIQPVDQLASIRELASEMDGGVVDTLVILGGNPVYTAPADLGFSANLQKVRLRVHLSLYQNETSALCHWHIPAAHYLESWSDARAFDGTVSIVQPLIAPLFGGKTEQELLAALSQRPQRSSFEIVRDYWRSRLGKSPEEFESFWRKTLHDGVMEGTVLPAKNVTFKSVSSLDQKGSSQGPKPKTPGTTSGTAERASATRDPKLETGDSLEILFRPDPSVFDGRFANNGWLQELPKPITKLTWENAALMSPATAQRLGLGYLIGNRGNTVEADVIELQFQGRSVRAPVFVVPGHANGAVTVHLGYGQSRAGRVGTDLGFNAYALRSSSTLWHGSGLQIRKTGERRALATTQTHHNIEGRDLVRSGTWQQYLDNPEFAHQGTYADKQNPSLYPEYPYHGRAWGMAIDLSLCLGCNACVVACQAENNIPVVGKDEVLRGREMHWLRVDSYFKGAVNNPETYYEPVPCMHCENAPCEVVCPVTATSHSAEGLNDMVYNRCVGTRYCSNNCPYKVRRFNFLQYSDWETPSLKALYNPDVTVRSRGVMEKCTYCVQRINKARIDAAKEDRPIRDGEIQTACQQACPAQAIIFGDINDRDSRVAKMKAGPRNFGLLEDLNTRPRTTYLAALRNPNPEISGSSHGKK